MEIGRYLVEAHLREGRSVAELAATHGVHRSWLYKLLARYRAEGDDGLRARSRRPTTSPRGPDPGHGGRDRLIPADIPLERAYTPHVDHELEHGLGLEL